MRKNYFFVYVVFFMTVVLLSGCLPLSAKTVSHEVSGDFDEGPGLQGKLVKTLAKALTPESMTVTFADEPGQDGKINAVYIEAIGSSFSTPYKLHRIALSGSFIRLAPAEQWDINNPKTLIPENWEGIFSAEIVLKEKDVHNAIETFFKGDKKQKDWSDISADFRPGKVFVRGRYKAGGGIGALFEITTGLELRGGKQIWLKDTVVNVNKDDQTGAIRQKLKEHNPPADITDLKLPLTLRKLKITDSELTVSTNTLPKPIEGHTWHYTNGN